MKLKFNLQDPALISLAKHAVANVSFQRGAWSTTERPLTTPSLLLVKDEGAYLMSPFPLKGAPVTARLCDEQGSLETVYAEGCSPTDPHIGGDDFADALPIAEMILEGSAKGAKSLVITVTAKTITTRIF